MGSKKGRKKPRADIVVFSDGSEHIQNIYIIVETKREDVKPSDKGNWTARELYICMYECSILWVGSERLAFGVAVKEGLRELEPIPDIPKKGETTIPWFSRPCCKPKTSKKSS